jgi:hypothetical protein
MRIAETEPNLAPAARGARTQALRVAVGVFGVLAALAGLEHGIGEILQGPVRPSSPSITSWPDAAAFQALGGEPALTLLPNLLVAGVTAALMSLALGVWSVGFVRGRRGTLVLMLLSIVLFLVGGGFGPPLMGIVLALVATRIGARSTRPQGGVRRRLGTAWRWILGVSVACWLAMLPGTVIVAALSDVDVARAVPLLILAAFTSLGLALASARAHDRAHDRTHDRAQP